MTRRYCDLCGAEMLEREAEGPAARRDARQMDIREGKLRVRLDVCVMDGEAGRDFCFGCVAKVVSAAAFSAGAVAKGRKKGGR